SKMISEVNGANILEMLNDKSLPFDQLKGLVGEERFNEMATDASKWWLEASRRGFDPIVMHSVDERQFKSALETNVVEKRAQTPERYKQKLLAAAPARSSVALGASAAVSERPVRQALRDILEPYSLPEKNGVVRRRADW